MVYVLDGAVRITISGIRYNLKKGEMIVMPARKPHALDALKRFKMMLVMIRS
jgi:quercetin dioxygenase-like cupin family protein